ncbi:hypothetical protein [Streptosporangium sp. NPDC003464]
MDTTDLSVAVFPGRLRGLNARGAAASECASAYAGWIRKTISGFRARRVT